MRVRSSVHLPRPRLANTNCVKPLGPRGVRKKHLLVIELSLGHVGLPTGETSEMRLPILPIGDCGPAERPYLVTIFIHLINGTCVVSLSTIVYRAWEVTYSQIGRIV